jgi:hypothetical protein
MMPFDAYRQYLALKNHFTKDSYDYHKYCGKSRATVQSFYKRKDRMWFEKVSRQKTDQEVIDFFVANFVSCPDPETLWIGDMIKEGDGRYKNSDDPEAKEMKQKIADSTQLMGLPAHVDMNVIFNNMTKMLEVMRQQIDKTGSDL